MMVAADSDGGVIHPREYSALTNFLRGYLHQDVAAEHGSPMSAAHAFRKDADEGETTVVRSELDRLLVETTTLGFSELSKILEMLGCAWHFRTREEVERLRDELK